MTMYSPGVTGGRLVVRGFGFGGSVPEKIGVPPGAVGLAWWIEIVRSAGPPQI
jgi:hypothetical protein